MRILFCIDSLAAGGKERRLVELMKELATRPEVIFQLVILSDKIHYEEVFSLGIKIYQIKRRSKRDLSIFYKVYSICKKFRPEIVHCWESMTAMYVLPICKLLTIKLVNGIVVDSPVKRNIFNKSWLRARLTFPFSDVVIGNSNAGLIAYNAPKKKSICIYNGIDLKRLNNLRDPSILRKQLFGDDSDDIFVIGMVAAFEERKDHKTLITAAKALINCNDHVRFVLIGDGANFTKIKNSVPDALSNKIIFLGRRSDVDSIVNIFNVGVLLTNTNIHGEGISNALLEYMALGKPVIATQGGGTDEVVIDDQNGYLIEVNDDTQLKVKIEILINNRSYCGVLGRNGIKAVQERFGIKVMTNRYMNVYQSLLI